jgi:hypothetical protein
MNPRPHSCFQGGSIVLASEVSLPRLYQPPLLKLKSEVFARAVAR